MLYQIYESQRALMAPFADFASATAKLYSHPLSPFAQSPGAQRVSAGFDLMHRLTKEYEGKFCNPYEAAARGYVDAVIEPHETRGRLIAGLRLLASKRDRNPPRKHGNVPL